MDPARDMALLNDSEDPTPEAETSPEDLRLAPHRQVQKFLVSTPAPLSDEFASPGLLVREAHTGLRQRPGHQHRIGPDGRTALIVSFRTPAADHDSFIIPDYDHVGDMVCAYLAVLYGKRFDNHGAIESSGFFRVPDLTALDAHVDRRLPTASGNPRADAPIPLSLGEVARLLPLLFGKPGRSPQATVFRTAARFYLRALQAEETDIEVAYLHLITAGEILSNSMDVSPEHLLDADTRRALEKIEGGLADGPKLARMIRGKLRAIRRRFVWAFEQLTDEAFFVRGEAKHAHERLKQNVFLKTLAAAYDLRSHYVHTGKAFDDWVRPRGNPPPEIHHGRPLMDDRSFAQILGSAPTFTGLERIVRYGLLRFAEQQLQVRLHSDNGDERDTTASHG